MTIQELKHLIIRHAGVEMTIDQVPNFRNNQARSLSTWIKHLTERRSLIGWH